MNSLPLLSNKEKYYTRMGVTNLILAWCWRGSLNNMTLFYEGTEGFGEHAEYFIWIEIIGLAALIFSAALLLMKDHKGAWLSTIALAYLAVQGWAGQGYNFARCMYFSMGNFDMCWQINNFFHYFTFKRLLLPIWDTTNWIANYFFLSWFVFVQFRVFVKLRMYTKD